MRQMKEIVVSGQGTGSCHFRQAMLAVASMLLTISGCATHRSAMDEPPKLGAMRTMPPHAGAMDGSIVLASYRPDGLIGAAGQLRLEPLEVIESAVVAARRLTQLETLAQSMNPSLRRLGQEAAAAEARIGHVGGLPDPTLAANLFAHPIETAAGSQRANLTLMQMIPWLGRLDAQTQQAYFEAMALHQAYEAERLKVVGTVRELWYRLYVLQKQVETSRANQHILQPMIDGAAARAVTTQASQADVRISTIAASKLEEQIWIYEQQIESTKAELNRAIGRDADHPIGVPINLEAALPDWSHVMLRKLAWEQQPEILAAELRTQATHWGIEVARLQRRPNISLSASWFAIDDNRPASTLVDVGRDAWSIGAQVSLPLWHPKNNAQEDEAAWRHAASHASVDETKQRYDALLRDLWEKAKTAKQMATLYQATLLPQVRETLEIDQQSYVNGNVDFDRLMMDVRNVLMVELGYHRTMGELAALLARIQQAVGTDLIIAPVETNLTPIPLPPPRLPHSEVRELQ
jgi:outer membrane protein TolC